MANLSDLLAGDAHRPAVPGWIDALGEGKGFIEGPVWGRGEAIAAAAGEDALELALAEAYSQGQAEGRKEALAESQLQSGSHELLRLAFRTLDEEACTGLAQALCQTVVELCEPVLIESAIDRAALEKRCEGAARRFGAAAGHFTLRLHPQDIDALDPNFLEDWRVEPDDALERGSIRLEDGAGSLADGPGEWRAAIASAITA